MGAKKRRKCRYHGILASFSAGCGPTIFSDCQNRSTLYLVASVFSIARNIGKVNTFFSKIMHKKSVHNLASLLHFSTGSSKALKYPKNRLQKPLKKGQNFLPLH
jgi:hypothetical protein